MKALAPAKINLFLHVLGQPVKGLHPLESLFAFLDVGDEVSVRPSPQLSLHVSGPYAPFVPEGQDNLVMKAAQALVKATGHSGGACIHLTKNLPPSSGLGGGSSDAAAALRLLCALWSVPENVAHSLAPSLGEDVPLCLLGKSLVLKGQKHSFRLLPPLGVVLLNPGVPLETKAVFASYHSPSLPFPPSPPCADLLPWLSCQRNDLTASAYSLCPPVHDALFALRKTPKCRLVRMSGSGATCFALYDTVEEAQQVASALEASKKGPWWIRATHILQKEPCLLEEDE